jgi:hypothetical protein
MPSTFNFNEGILTLLPIVGQKLENKSKENEEEFDFSFKNKKETLVVQPKKQHELVS